jgi:hypothetical protein
MHTRGRKLIQSTKKFNAYERVKGTNATVMYVRVEELAVSIRGTQL